MEGGAQALATLVRTVMTHRVTEVDVAVVHEVLVPAAGLPGLSSLRQHWGCLHRLRCQHFPR
jgi:hypothetical protein